MTEKKDYITREEAEKISEHDAMGAFFAGIFVTIIIVAFAMVMFYMYLPDLHTHDTTKILQDAGWEKVCVEWFKEAICFSPDFKSFDEKSFDEVSSWCAKKGIYHKPVQWYNFVEVTEDMSYFMHDHCVVGSYICLKEDYEPVCARYIWLPPEEAS